MKIFAFSYFRALKMFITLSGYGNLSKRTVTIKRAFYPDIDSDSIPYKQFIPGKHIRHDFIIYPGASHAAEEHEHLDMLGRAIAGAGYRVTIPRIPALKKLLITEDISDRKARFYKWFLSKYQVPPQSVSLIGVSFGGAMTLKATLSKNMTDLQPRSVLSYGTFYRFDTTSRFLLTGKIKTSRSTIKIKPDNWGLVVLLHNYLKDINIGYDTKTLQKLLYHRVRDDEDSVNKISKQLSSDEDKLYQALENSQPSTEINRTIETILVEKKQYLNRLSPSTFAENINVPVFIIHGSKDSMVPFTEAILLGRKIDHSQLLVTKLYEHKDLTGDGNIFNTVKEFYLLLKFMANYLYFCDTGIK